MGAYTSEQCRSCHAWVIWAETQQGKAMPVDVEPHPDGDIQLRERPGQKPLAIVIRKVGDRFGKKLRRSHFATCRDADRWRHKRGGR